MNFEPLQSTLLNAIGTITRSGKAITIDAIVDHVREHQPDAFAGLADTEITGAVSMTVHGFSIAPGLLGFLQMSFAATVATGKLDGTADVGGIDAQKILVRIWKAHPELEREPLLPTIRAFLAWLKEVPIQDVANA
jgi:hypothetical protein